MKAVVVRSYGGPEVLRVEEAPRPAAGPGEILVRVVASSVTTADWRLRAAAFPGVFWLPGRIVAGLFRPRHAIPGADFAGPVEAVGDGVTRFRPGDTVFGTAGHGAHSEYLAMPADGTVARMPEGIGFADAAALPFGGLAALAFLRNFAGLKAGERVMVVGASGGVGVYAVQIARAMGAEVTGVASAGSLDLARSLGADHVVDYGREDLAATGREYDVVLDTVGATDFAAIRGALAEGGRFVTLNGGLRIILQALTTRRASRRVVFGVSPGTREELEALAEMVAGGRVRAVIDRRYRLEEIAEAHRYVEGRRRRGAVVLEVAPEAFSQELSQ